MARSIGWTWALRPRRRSFWLRSEIAISSWYGQAVSGSFTASRFTALIVVERRRVALLFLMVVVSRLTTPLLWQWLMIHPVLWRGCACLVALATSMRLRRFSTVEQSFVARSIGCSWALSPRRRSFGCGGKLLYRHGTVRQSRAVLLPRALRRSSWSSGAWSPYSS